MDEPNENKEKLLENSCDRIKENLEDLVNGFRNLLETLEKIGVNEMSENSDLNVALKDTTMGNKKNETKMNSDTLQVSEMPCISSKTSETCGNNTMKSETLNSINNFNKYTGTLTSTLKCFEDISEAYTSEIDFDFSDFTSETSSSTAKLSNGGSPGKTLDIDSEVHATPNNDVLQNVRDVSDCTTETSTATAKYSHDNSDVAVTFVTAEQVREGIQKAMESLSKPPNPFDDFLVGHGLDTFNDLHFWDSGSMSCNYDLKLPTSDQVLPIDQRPNKVFKFPSKIQDVVVIIAEGNSSSDTINVDGIATVSDDENISNIDENWEYRINSIDQRKDQSKALADISSGRNMNEFKRSMSFFNNSESSQCSLQFPNQDLQSFHSYLKFPNDNQDNNNKVTNNNNLNFGQELTIALNKSFPINETFDNQESNINSVATALKDISCDWEQLSLAEKCLNNRRRLLAEFLSDSYLNASENSDLHRDWKRTDNDQDLNIDSQSRNVLRMLQGIRRYMINNNLSPSDINANYDEMFGSKKPPTNSAETNDREPDTLTNIFQTVFKCHPLKKFEVPPYASANPDEALGITQRRLNDSDSELEHKHMQLHDTLENPPILSECSNIDSNSFMFFENNDCFSVNSSIICDALIKDYLSVAVKINIFLLKQVKDVSFEDCEKIMDNLHCLDDELGYLSAKLIVAKNDWVKQYDEINQNVRNNSQMTKSSKGLYHMSLLRICMEVAKILLDFCFQKQLELENYENGLIFSLECRG